MRYKGIKFRRYPDSNRRTERVYWTPGIGDRQRGVRRLHEEIWQDTHGVPIPPGWQVHHRDGDPLNNDPANLECLPAVEHQSGRHGEEHRARSSSAVALEHLERIRPLAAAWHSSPEGIAWHSANGRAVWASRKPQELICERCGAAYETRSRSGDERFCSNACKSAWRRASGVDNVILQCPVCGMTFATNKYRRSLTCSRRCGAVVRQGPRGPQSPETRARKSEAMRRVWSERRAKTPS